MPQYSQKDTLRLGRKLKELRKRLNYSQMHLLREVKAFCAEENIPLQFIPGHYGDPQLFTLLESTGYIPSRIDTPLLIKTLGDYFEKQPSLSPEDIRFFRTFKLEPFVKPFKGMPKDNTSRVKELEGTNDAATFAKPELRAEKPVKEFKPVWKEFSDQMGTDEKMFFAILPVGIVKNGLTTNKARFLGNSYPMIDGLAFRIASGSINEALKHLRHKNPDADIESLKQEVFKLLKHPTHAADHPGIHLLGDRELSHVGRNTLVDDKSRLVLFPSNIFYDHITDNNIDKRMEQLVHRLTIEAQSEAFRYARITAIHKKDEYTGDARKITDFMNEELRFNQLASGRKKSDDFMILEYMSPPRPFLSPLNWNKYDDMMVSIENKVHDLCTRLWLQDRVEERKRHEQASGWARRNYNNVAYVDEEHLNKLHGVEMLSDFGVNASALSEFIEKQKSTHSRA